MDGLNLIKGNQVGAKASPTGLLDSLKRSGHPQTATDTEKRMGGVPIESAVDSKSAITVLVWPGPTYYATGANAILGGPKRGAQIVLSRKLPPPNFVTP